MSATSKLGAVVAAAKATKTTIRAGVVNDVPDATHATVDIGDRSVLCKVPASVGMVAAGQVVRVEIAGNRYTVQAVISYDRTGGTVAARTYYEKKLDGTLICRGSYGFPANAGASQSYVWTFPVPFVGEAPFITVTPDTTAPQNCPTSKSGVSLTGCTIWLTRSTNAATTVDFEAEGRWQ